MQKHSRLSEYFIGWILFFSALTMNRFPYLCHLYRYQNPSSCALGSHSHIGSRNRHKRRPLRHSTPNLSVRAEISFRNSRAIIQDVLACNLYNVISHGTRSPPPQIRKHYSALPTGLMKIPNEWQCSKWKWCFKISSNRVLFVQITVQAWVGSERLTAEKEKLLSDQTEVNKKERHA